MDGKEDSTPAKKSNKGGNKKMKKITYARKKPPILTLSESFSGNSCSKDKKSSGFF
jgi:hypothetical protein